MEGAINGKKENPSRVLFAMDIHGSTGRPQSIFREMSPTLTRSRAATGGYFLTKYMRMQSTSEIARLQGFPLLRRAGATDRQLRQMLGNAMTVPILARVSRMALAAIGLINLKDVPDPCIK